MSVTPFTIHITPETLTDLQERLARTRWTDEVSGAGWEYGTNLAYLKEFVDYWQHHFDWRTQERALNAFSHFHAQVDGFGLHFIHERGKGDHPLPLVLLHGWPSSFWQMLTIIPLLTDPVRYGGDAADSFDVIVPSLPGYGFSDRPSEKGMGVGRIADLLAKLLTEELGYERFATRASDLGAGVSQQLALTHAQQLIGIHQSGTNPYVGHIPDNLTRAEQEFVANAERWNQQEMAYAMEHASRPQTLAYSLNDSPAGLAAWIVEKFRAWSDCEGDIEKRFSKDDLLTNLTIYWATQTINSSIRLYYETVRNPGRWGRVEVPTAMLMSPKDMFPTPREWVERSYHVQRWTEIPSGGHFLEREEPERVAEDLRAFFRPFRQTRKK
jgi:pimeloyl-ACP methyl ester carboxylesterase